jgi:hypothetical protein
MAKDKKATVTKRVARALHRHNRKRFEEFYKPVKALCQECGEVVGKDNTRCVRCGG